MPEKSLTGLGTYWHVTPCRNVPAILRNGLVPAVGSRSENARETEPGIYLFGTVEDMENAMMNWLGDETDGTDPWLLHVRLPDGFANAHVRQNAFEYVCRERIPPDWITPVKPL